MLIPFTLYILRLHRSRRRFNLVKVFLDLFSGHHGLQALFFTAEGDYFINSSAKWLSRQEFRYLKK